MPKDLKRNAIIVLGLAALFHCVFLFAKHDPALRNAIPFGEDPYDAVGSFGDVVGILLALVSAVRAFWPYQYAPSPAERRYLIRTQAAVVFGVLITLSADSVAMARHPSMWVGARYILIAQLGRLLTCAIAVLWLIRTSRGVLPESGSNRWTRAVVVALLALLILLLYPEQLIHRTATHLLTVVAGALLLCAPLRFLLTAFAPVDLGEARIGSAGYRWALVLLLGALIGACLVVAELSEGGGAPPTGRLVFVASVFIGLATAGLLIAYAFLGAPLGLGPQSERLRTDSLSTP